MENAIISVDDDFTVVLGSASTLTLGMPGMIEEPSDDEIPAAIQS